MVVAGRVSATLHIQLVISAFFCIVSGYISFALLADYITYNTLLIIFILPGVQDLLQEEIVTNETITGIEHKS